MQWWVGFFVLGGNEKVCYYINGDVYQEEGIVQDFDYDCYFICFNGDFMVIKWLDIGVRVQLLKSFVDEMVNVIIEFNFNGGFVLFILISNNILLGDVYDVDGNLIKFIKDDQFQINLFYCYQEFIFDCFVMCFYINFYLNVKLLFGFKYILNIYVEDWEEFFG